MSAPGNVFALDLDVAESAAERWESRKSYHTKFEAAAKNKQFTKVESRERCAARANRLLANRNTMTRSLTESIAAGFTRDIGAQIGTASLTAEDVSDAVLERVINETRDFQFIEFLEMAIWVAKSVGRVVTRLKDGRMSYGTGFMVSPDLLITNHHVFPSLDMASRSTIEFNFQRDRFGDPLPVKAFQLDPARFFLNDKQLDYALVAVKQDANETLNQFGWCPLIKDPGKIIPTENINIIQHPLGEVKQIVIRENRLIDTFQGEDDFLHYEADTEPGSSGSPVFNDQWEVVALHHSGVPKRNPSGEWLDVKGDVWKKGDNPSRIDWIANEGIRVSKIVESVSKASLRGEANGMQRRFLDALPSTEKQATSQPDLLPPPRPSTLSKDSRMQGEKKPTGTSVTLTIPLHITFTLGNLTEAGIQINGSSVGPATDDIHDEDVATEKITPAPDYENRTGYDPKFLGFDTPFPRLTAAIRKNAYAMKEKEGDARFLLHYYHYSLLFNQARNLAFVAGVNFDPLAKVKHPRDKEGDKWFYDPRVQPKDLKTGERLYSQNPLDRGHLVRRADSAWGKTAAEAKLANDDTFHFTNCSPQHEITNQGISSRAPETLKLWGNLEEHIASQGKENKRKLCIFNGPIFRQNDKKYRDVQIPKEFWKVVVFESDDGEPSAVAFILSQAALIEELKEEFEVGEYKTVQVSMRDMETKTKLDFGDIRKWDVLDREGADESLTDDTGMKVLNSLDDMIL